MMRRKISSGQARTLEQLERRMLLAAVPLDIGQFKARAGQFGQLGNITLFTTTDFPTGQKLWATDGTAAGTRLVKDLENAPSNGAAWFIDGRDNALVVGNTYYFTGVDNARGRELWASDGTTAGTRLVADLALGSNDSNPEGFVALGNQLIFTADKKLWRTDGTPGGTVMLKDADPLGDGLPERMAAMGGHVYFTIYPTQNPYNSNFSNGELWRTDGTPQGTVLVRDISPGTDPVNVAESRSGLINVNGTLYFSANDGAHGWELWKYDTAGGPKLVRDLAPTPVGPNPFFDGSYPSNLTNVNGTLFFSAAGFLYRTDGTAAGTVKLKTVSNARGFVNANGTLYFSSFNSLWRSDGTKPGSVLLSSIEPAERFGPDAVATLNGRMFFGASAENGFELYETDGSIANTTLAFDAEPGPASSHAQPLGRTGDKVIFTARNESTALWQVYAMTVPAPHLPRNLKVAPRHDTGLSMTDGVTHHSTPTISGAAQPDTMVTLYINGAKAGTAVAKGGSFAIATPSTLADGTYTIQATATDDLGRSGSMSHPIDVTIDTTAPRISFKAVSQQVLELKFSEDVAGSLEVADLTLRNLTTGRAISRSAMELKYNEATNTASLTFPNFIAGLVPGKYRLTIDPTGVTDVAGNAMSPPTAFNFEPPAAPRVGKSRGELRISGSNSDDEIIVRHQKDAPSRLEVSINGRVTNHPVAGITGIRIQAFAGDDLIRYDHSNGGAVLIGAIIYAGDGNDTVFGSATRDRIYGEGGDDVIRGSAGHDIIYGGPGRDHLMGDVGNDRIVGGLDRDTIQGDRGFDRLFVENGVDEVISDKLDTLLSDAA